MNRVKCDRCLVGAPVIFLCTVHERRTWGRKQEAEEMSEKKIVFFDIDGTLWNWHNEIPESTIRAIRSLRQNGHRAFLCSGRSRAYIQNPDLFAIGFDGVVSGCGTMIEYGGETIFYKKLDVDLVEHTVNTVRKYGMRPILEGREYLYMDEREFAKDNYGKKLKAEIGPRLLTIADEWGRWEISKISCATETADREKCYEELKDCFDFIIHDIPVTEFVPKGYHKGTGIEKVCEMLDTDIKDTIAFGDSANDIGMFRAAGIGVAMGNSSEDVKLEADYVTTPVMEDGIWKACKHLELI